MTSDQTSVHRLTPDELATLFLFEALTPEQLDWLSERGSTESRPAGAVLFAEGDEATCFYVLLSGTITLQAAHGTDADQAAPLRRRSFSGLDRGRPADE